MSKIIIYASCYGATKSYALELSKITGIDAISYKDVKDINPYDTIIYFGALYAGVVKGLAKTFKSLKNPEQKKIVLVTVGLTDPSDEATRNSILKSIQSQVSKEIFQHAKIFHMRGAIDYSKLKFAHKTLMSLLYHFLKKRSKESGEYQVIVDTYQKNVSFVDFKQLDDIVKEIKND